MSISPFLITYHVPRVKDFNIPLTSPLLNYSSSVLSLQGLISQPHSFCLLLSRFISAILRQECPALSCLWIAEKCALLVEKPRADSASCCTLAGRFSVDLLYIRSLFESGVPPGGMASFLVRFSSQAFATLSYRSSAFSRGLFHIGNLLHSLRAEPRSLWLSSPFLFLKLPYFFFFLPRLLFPSAFRVLALCSYLPPSEYFRLCVALNVLIAFSSVMTRSSWKQIPSLSKTLCSFAWGQTN